MSSCDDCRLVIGGRPGMAITVRDSELRPVADEIGQLTTTLSPGLYQVQFQVGRTVREEIVRVPEGRDEMRLDAPELAFATPVPIDQARELDDGVGEGAAEASRRIDLRLGGGGGLLVFVRDRDRRGRASPLTRIQLADTEGRPIADLAEHGVVGGSRSARWAGCSVALDPGTYRLRVATHDAGTLEQSVTVSPGWQTQVFMIRRTWRKGAHGRTASLPGASVLMAEEGVGFEPAGDDLRLAELSRQGLIDGDAILSADDIHNLLYGKWRNPMLGIYGLHLMASRGEQPAGQLEPVLDNLRHLVGDHPDVRALALWTDPQRAVAPFPLPPMLRSSWSLVVRATAHQPELMPRESLSGRVAERLFGTGAWVTWRAAHRRRHRRPDNARRRVAAAPLADGVERLSSAVASRTTPGAEANRELTPLAQGVMKLAEEAARGEHPGEQHIVERLQVPRSVAAEAVGEALDAYSL